MAVARERQDSRLLRAEILLAFCATVCVCKLLFEELSPTGFFGDDLSNYLAFKAGRFGVIGWGAATEVYADKYRPVFSIVWGSVMSLAAADFSLLLWINLIIEGLIAAVIYGGLRSIPRVTVVLALAVSITVACSRFSLYQVTQITGLVESVSLFFFVCALWITAQAARHNSNTLLFAAAWAMLACSMFTHERYLAAIPWFGVAWFILLRRWPWRKRLIYLSIPAGMVVINILSKKLLGTTVLQGTGGAAISLLPGVKFLANIEQAFLSLSGFNFGPDYLVGRSALERDYAGGWAPFVAGATFLTMLFPFVALAWKSDPMDGNEFQVGHWKLIPFVLGLAVMMLIPPALTIRMEQRWLLVPHLLIFISMLLAVASISSVQKRRLVAFVLFVHCCLWFLMFSLLKPSLGNIFFVDSGRVATRIAVDVSPTAAKLPADGRLYFVMRQDHCDWTLLGGQFFAVYGAGPRPVECLIEYKHSQSGDQVKNAAVFGRNVHGKFLRLDEAYGCASDSGRWNAPLFSDAWMGGVAEVVLGRCSGTLRISAFLPSGFPARNLTISVDGSVVGVRSILPGEKMEFNYPLGTTPQVRVSLVAGETNRPVDLGFSQDVRELGLVVQSMSTEAPR